MSCTWFFPILSHKKIYYFISDFLIDFEFLHNQMQTVYRVLDIYIHQTNNSFNCFLITGKNFVQIIPEIDMPGHSTYFKNCFGFPMHDPRGINILEELLEEFCREIPAEMSPYLHIGADEIRIPNGKQFADRMAAKVKSLGRQPIQWAGNNDLPVSGDSYAQLWNDENSVGLPDPARQKNPYFDSTAGYVNSFDPGILVRRNFFRQPCGTARGNNHSLGVIQCLWPDTRVENKKNIPVQSPQWPAMFAMAERSWKGIPEDGSRFAGSLPEKNTEAYQAFSLFEKRMEALAGSILSWNGRYSAPFRRTGRKK